MAVGSVPRTLPIPGLADWAMGFKNVEEAIALRNRVLECLDIAETATDPEIRERNLTFVFVGGGYAGVEAIAETEDLARYATRYLRNVTPEDLRFVLVEATGADPARGGRGHGRAGPSSSCASAASTSSSRPGSSRPSTGTWCSPTARPCSPTRSCGRPA